MKKHFLIYLSFFLSGATALMYEIIWTRYFSLTFGSTAYSITAVLTAFMAGLALGSLIIGKVADRIRRRLMFYGWIELLIGLYALLFPMLYGISTRFFIDTFDPTRMDAVETLLTRFVLSFVLMLIPTMLMGGSLPTLSRVLIRNLKAVPSKLGILYAVNTFGAVAGTYLAGFHLIITLGVKESMVLAAVLNIIIGMAMMLYSKKYPETPDASLDAETESSPVLPEKRENIIVVFAFVAFALSGFVSLSYEVVWTRILALIIGSSTYAFTMILIGFLLGIALGSFLIGHEGLISERRIHLVLFSWLQIGIGISAYLLIPLFSQLPAVMLRAFEFRSASYQFVTVYQFILVLAIVIIPTTLMGATLPVIGKIVARQMHSVGRSVGNLYFVNTFGAIFGALLTGFFFMEYLGMLRSLKLGIMVNLLLGLAGILLAAFHNRQRKIVLLSLLGAVVSLSVVWISKWDVSLMDSGVSIYGHEIVKRGGKDRSFKNGSRLLYYHDGMNATITVRKAEDYVYLKANGKADASTSQGDMMTQTLLGYLPVALHPEPVKALVIGMGSGVTASTIAQYDSVRSLHVVEIEPAVVEAATFFHDVNFEVLNNSKTTLFINDGRNHLMESDETYDLIVSEPSNPWISGIGSLYTKEYFSLANRKLRPGGIFCQWIHSYSMSLDNLRMILGTVASSFQDFQLWDSDLGDFLLVGSNREIDLDPSVIGKAMVFSERTRGEFSEYLLVEEPLELVGRLLLDKQGIQTLSEGTRINTDNHPYLEFFAPRDLYRDDRLNNFRTISSLYVKGFPDSLNHFSDPRQSARVYFGRSKLYSYIQWQKKAKAHAEAALLLDNREADYHYQLGKILFWENRIEEARDSLERGMAIRKTSDGIRAFLAVKLSMGEVEEALNLLERNSHTMKDYESQRGELLYVSGRSSEAIPVLLEALRKKQGKEYLLLEMVASSYDATNQPALAEKYYLLSLAKEDMNKRTRQALADLYYRNGYYEQARNHYLFLTQYWEVDPDIYARLASTYRKLGDNDRANHITEKVLPRLRENNQ